MVGLMIVGIGSKHTCKPVAGGDTLFARPSHLAVRLVWDAPSRSREEGLPPATGEGIFLASSLISAVGGSAEAMVRGEKNLPRTLGGEGGAQPGMATAAMSRGEEETAGKPMPVLGVLGEEKIITVLPCASDLCAS